MRKQIFITLVTACLVALVISVPARAQMPGTTIRAIIPFDFIVRGKILPAGNYEIRRIGDSPDTLVIRSVNDNHEHAFFDTVSIESLDGFENSELVFHHYGDSYFLSEIVTAGEQTGRELIPSRAERQLRSAALARNGADAETVDVAAY